MTLIDRCDVFLCVSPVREARGPSSGWYQTRESVLTLIGDSDGRTGWGEASLRPGVVAAAQQLGDLLLGTEPRHSAALLDRLTATTADQWAVSALAVAVDDLAARQLGVPVYELYGGPRRAEGARLRVQCRLSRLTRTRGTMAGRGSAGHRRWFRRHQVPDRALPAAT